LRRGRRDLDRKEARIFHLHHLRRLRPDGVIVLAIDDECLQARLGVGLHGQDHEQQHGN
jgi:hypothetical protein